ncbi:acetyl-CoA carboxylase biotin carboxyl carrier protein [Ruminococcus sp. JL13D9]|uniref:acetyl-CoA carboxylase biotin carboxyl carrier protein n=1 Tax=Ruminococcus sp. JL13D9 TaxID=3233381 RepID=UPI00389A94D4|nr:acetyl-CoA carboxylase biotin carboxyl carrier protein [Ruminococcus sp.]
MIDISTLKEYIKVLEECSLEKLEISDGTDTISLEKAHAAAAAPAAVTVNAAPAPAAAPAVSTAEPDNGKTISAPIVGVFYAAPSPESDPYVHVGKRVKKGDVVCIIEAMKCMNEIQAEEDGEITAVLATNGELVEYNQPLFAIK